MKLKRTLLIIILTTISIFNSYSQKVIKMERKNGVYYVPCKVNGVPMKFVFDTGASDVSISLTEAKFLMKQGFLKDADIKESVKYKIANGDIQKGTKITLREINIDGIIINDVEASIVHQLNAPLLLGQSVISKLGKIRLDENLLIIESENKSNNYTNFLNIDVTKTLFEYDFNPELNKMFRLKNLPINEEGVIAISIPLSFLKKNNNHFLKDFNFDTEIVKFKKNGFLRAMMLSKKSKNINLEFSKLSERISSVYGKYSKYGRISKIWKKPYFEIGILKNEGILSVILDVKIDKDVLKKDLRTNFVKITNDYFKLSDKDKNNLIRFIRTEEDNLVVYIQNNIETNKNNFKISGKEKEWIQFLCYNSAEILLGNESFNRTIVNGLKYENIVFNVELTYFGINRVKTKKHISKLDIKNLRVPFTKGELLNILK